MSDPRDLFKKLVRERNEAHPVVSDSASPEPKKRGRPATGKRSVRTGLVGPTTSAKKLT